MIDTMKGPVGYGQLQIALSVISGRITELDPEDYKILIGRDIKVKSGSYVTVTDGIKDWCEDLLFHAILRGINLH